jgi:hypothetical protein
MKRWLASVFSKSSGKMTWQRADNSYSDEVANTSACFVMKMK